MADERADKIEVEKQLAYSWDEKAKKVRKVWLPAIVRPKSFRAVADKVEAEKALRRKKRKGIIKP